jgi:DNA-binding CsgD family transcriptional regulator
MASDQLGRRLLAALAATTPAFTRPPRTVPHTPGRRLLAALAGITPAFTPGTDVDQHTSAGGGPATPVVEAANAIDTVPTTATDVTQPARPSMLARFADEFATRPPHMRLAARTTEVLLLREILHIRQAGHFSLSPNLISAVDLNLTRARDLARDLDIDLDIDRNLDFHRGLDLDFHRALDRVRVRVRDRGFVIALIVDLGEAVNRTAADDAVFTAGQLELVLGDYRRMAATPDEDKPQLTERETEVLRLVAKGLSYKQIAGRLVLSHRTVQNHVQNTLRKLQLHNRVQLVRYAIEQGLDDAQDR